jgi:predicted ATPase
MYVSGISLLNWKNFKKASAGLSNRTFLIGPNASGKSNLLDAFRFLRDVSTLGLGAAVDARGGVSAIRCLAARQSSAVSLEFTLAEGAFPQWRYLLEFNQDANRKARVRREVVETVASSNLLLSRPTPEDERDPERLSQTALQQIAANRDFREVADFLATISYQHVLPQVVRDPRQFSPGPVKNDPYGRDLLMRIWNTAIPTRTAWLHRISRVLQAAVPQLQDLDIEMDSQGIPHLVGRYEHWRAYAARQNEAQFSDGTLRLFGLMWSMFDGTGPLLLEEPELSLHPQVVRLIPHLLVKLQDEIRKMKRKGGLPQRQVIISTHSEDLLGDLGISGNEVLRIEPSIEGSRIIGPDEGDVELLKAGLSAAEVLLPKAAPSHGQLRLPFDE